MLAIIATSDPRRQPGAVCLPYTHPERIAAIVLERPPQAATLSSSVQSAEVMFSYSYDLSAGAGVCLFSGPSNRDEDYQAYLEVLLDLDARWARLRPAMLLLVEPGNPLPSAAWRRRIADATRSLRSRPYVAFVSESPLMRGAVIAINWLRPPPFEFVIEEGVVKAIDWLEKKRERALPFPRLLHQVRASAKAGAHTGAP